MLTITIELQVFHDGTKKDLVMLKHARMHAKQLLSAASLIQDRLAPRIRLEAGEFGYSSTAEIALFDDQGNELEAAPAADPHKHIEKRGLESLDLNVKPEDDEE